MVYITTNDSIDLMGAPSRRMENKLFFLFSSVLLLHPQCFSVVFAILNVSFFIRYFILLKIHEMNTITIIISFLNHLLVRTIIADQSHRDLYDSVADEIICVKYHEVKWSWNVFIDVPCFSFITQTKNIF
jgi:hypothetical protein